MGGCASKPAEFNSRPESLPIEAPTSPKKVEDVVEPVVTQETVKDEVEVSQKEEPLVVDLSETKPEEEVFVEQPVKEEDVEKVEVVHEETVEPKVEEAEVAAVEVPTETTKTEKVEEVAKSSDDKSDAPLITV